MFKQRKTDRVGKSKTSVLQIYQWNMFYHLGQAHLSTKFLVSIMYMYLPKEKHGEIKRAGNLLEALDTEIRKEYQKKKQKHIEFKNFGKGKANETITVSEVPTTAPDTVRRTKDRKVNSGSEAFKRRLQTYMD